MPHAAIVDSIPDFTGRVLGGIHLLEILGSGAYGKVYRAIDLSSPLTQPVHCAVKCLLRPDRGSRQEQFQKRELQLHQVVSDHPNVVGFHRVVDFKKYVFVILDICEGGDLFSAITEQKVFCSNDNLVRSVFIQLIDAVQHCHDSDVYHRDIKPENVLVSKDGTRVFLADFGLATDSRVSTDFGCGSSYYMSPECIGKEFRLPRYSTRQSDIWSLGIILTNMISGRNPWRYAMTSDDCFAAYLKDPSFLRDVLPISAEASRILTRIFIINPLARISLPNLREEILSIETFFMTDTELALASPQCRGNAKAYTRIVPIKQVPRPVLSPLDGTANPGETATKSVELYAPAPVRPPPTTGIFLDKTDSSNSSSSSSASDGPITPETHAQDPDVEVPALTEDEGIGKRMDLIKISSAKVEIKTPKPRAPSNVDMRPPPRRLGNQLLNKMAKRFQAISGSSPSLA